MLIFAWDYVEAYGHVNISATHSTTFEITCEDFVTPRGDCIIGCKASKSIQKLSEKLKEILKTENSIILIILNCEDVYDYVICYGSNNLILGSDKRIIVRKGTYIDEATLCINANKAAKDINRSLVEKLKMGKKLCVWIIGIKLIQNFK